MSNNRELIFLFCSMVLGIWIQPSYCDSGYLFTAPKTLHKGTNETVCLAFHDVQDDIFVMLRLAENTTVWASADHIFRKGKGGCFEIYIPDDPPKKDPYNKYEMEVIGGALNIDYGFTSHAEFRLDGDMSTQILIQTDKPIYKPGQTVRFRVVAFDSKLRPLTAPIEEAIVLNPSGSRLMQWKDIAMDTGLAQFEMGMSAEPPLGMWKITVMINGKKESQKFEIKKYVLPKFEVTITPPKFITPFINEIEVKICASYTYGKEVEGKVFAEVCLLAQPYWYMCVESNRPCYRYKQCLSHTKQIKGCSSVYFNGTSLGLPFDTYRPWNTNLVFTASVQETVTGITLKKSSVIKRVVTEEIKVNFEDVNELYRPGLPFQVKAKVTLLTGEPIAEEEVEVTAKDSLSELTYKRSFVTDSAGYVYFALPPVNEGAPKFGITAIATRYQYDASRWPEGYMRMTIPSDYVGLKCVYSPSRSYLSLANVPEDLPCTETATFRLLYTTRPKTETTFYYQIKRRIFLKSYNWNDWLDYRANHSSAESKASEESASSSIKISSHGSIVKQGEATHYFDGDAAVFNLDEQMLMYASGPSNSSEESAYILVESDDILVSSHIAKFSLDIDIDYELSPLSQLLVYFIRPDGEVVADGREFTVAKCLQNQVSVEFSSDEFRPGSLASLSISASANSLCGLGVVDRSVQIMGGDNQIKRDKIFDILRSSQPVYYDYSYGRRSSISDYCTKKYGEIKPIENKTQEYWSDYIDAAYAFNKIVTQLTDLAVETRPCFVQDMIIARFRMYGRRGVGGAGHYDSAPIALSMKEGGPLPGAAKSSSPSVRTYFPETWLWDIIPVGDTGIITIEKAIPHTITEWRGNAVCMNSDTGIGISETASVKAFQAFFIRYNLPYSIIRGEKILFPVTVFNYLEQKLAIRLTLEVKDNTFKLDGEDSVFVCVEGNGAKTHEYLITALQIGEMNLTVYAHTIEGHEECSGSAKYTIQDAISKPLLVEPEGIPAEYTQASFICPQDLSELTFDLPLPENVVKDSERGYISVIGNILGPTLTNLARLVRLPTGCGEQNMVAFAPNIYVLEYLSENGKLTDELRNSALHNMRTGYQRQLTFRHDNGSFGSWGEQGEIGSTWLTSFIVKCFAQAMEHIYIDRKDLHTSIAWLNATMMDDGCFRKIGYTHSTNLQGGFRDTSTNYSVTAFTLITLLEASHDTKIKEMVKYMVSSSLQCLLETPINDTYTLALLTYALSLDDVNSQTFDKYLDKMKKLAVEKDGLRYWKNDVADDSGSRRWWNYYYSSAEVEITSYIAMALFNKHGRDNLQYTLPIIQWLIKQRNPYGGFTSTQDTVVGLQALTKLATSVDFSDLSLTLDIDDTTSEFRRSFKVDNENSLLLMKQRFDMPASMSVTSHGQGCALVQFSVRFNLEGETPKQPAFKVDARVLQNREDPKNCERRSMRVCHAYIHATLPNDVQSRMTVMEVKLVTGWTADEASLDEVVKNQISSVKKYEVDGKFVIFYFDEIMSLEQCVVFNMDRTHKVNNTKPGTVKIFDYYDTAVTLIQEYKVEENCGSYHHPWWGHGFGREGAPMAALDIAETGGSEVSPETEVAVQQPSCPACHNQTQEGLEQMICNSAYAYKSSVRKNNKLKVLADLRPSNGKTSVNQFVGYEMHESCSCHLLSAGRGKVIILTLYQIKDQKLTCDSSVIIFKALTQVEKTIRKAVSQSDCKQPTKHLDT